MPEEFQSYITDMLLIADAVHFWKITHAWDYGEYIDDNLVNNFDDVCLAEQIEAIKRGYA